MSTKIYDGFRIPTPRGSEFLDFRRKVTSTIQPFLENGFYKMTAYYLINVIDRYMSSLPPIIEFGDADSTSALTVVKKFLKEKVDNSELTLAERDTIHDFSFRLHVYPFDDYTYLLPSCAQTNATYLLNNINGIESFSYWNNTDKPKDISDTEWETRKNIWNSVLEHEPFDIFISQRDFFWKIEENMEQIVQSQPLKHARTYSLTKHSLIKEYLESDTKLKTSNVVYSIMKAYEWVVSEENKLQFVNRYKHIEESILPAIYPEHITMNLSELVLSKV